MKVWKRKKRALARYRWSLDDPRRFWLPMGYYGNRPHLLMGRNIDRVHTVMIGHIESVRFVFSDLEQTEEPHASLRPS